MYLRFGKINISLKNVILGVIALFLSIILAYYLVFDENSNENKLKNLGDYFNYIYTKIYFGYVVVFMTIVFYNVLHYLLDNREFIKSRGQSFVNNTIGRDFINRSIRGGVDATNKIYDYSGRAYNYLRPKRVQLNRTVNVGPGYNPFD